MVARCVPIGQSHRDVPGRDRGNPDGDDVTWCSAILRAPEAVFVAKAAQMAEDLQKTPSIRTIPLKCNLEGAPLQGPGNPAAPS